MGSRAEKNALFEAQASGREARRLQDGWPEWQLAEKTTKKQRRAA